MHSVTREASRWIKDARKATEDACFPDPSVELSLLVLSFVWGGEDVIEITSICVCIYWGQVIDVEVWMIGAIAIVMIFAGFLPFSF